MLVYTKYPLNCIQFLAFYYQLLPCEVTLVLVLYLLRLNMSTNIPLSQYVEYVLHLSGHY